MRQLFKQYCVKFEYLDKINGNKINRVYIYTVSIDDRVYITELTDRIKNSFGLKDESQLNIIDITKL